MVEEQLLQDQPRTMKGDLPFLSASLDAQQTSHFLPAGKTLTSFPIRIYSHLIVRRIEILLSLVNGEIISKQSFIWRKKKRKNKYSIAFSKDFDQMQNERHRGFKPFLWEDMAVSMEHHIKGTQTTAPWILKIMVASPIKFIINSELNLTEEKGFFP